MSLVAAVGVTMPTLHAQLPSLSPTARQQRVPNRIEGINSNSYVNGHGYGEPEGMTYGEAYELRSQCFSDPRVKVPREAYYLLIYAAKATTWQQAHKATIEYFATISSVPNTLWAYQETAQDILFDYLLHQSPTVELQQTIEFYLNILLQYRNYHIYEIIGKSLLSLKGYWSDEKIAQTAKKVIEADRRPAQIPSLELEKDLLLSAWHELGGDFKEGSGDATYHNAITAYRAELVEKLRAIYEEYIQSYPNKELSAVPRIEGIAKNIQPIQLKTARAYRWRGIIAVLAQGQGMKKK